MLVPDTGGVINGNRRSKSQVVTFANGTVAHEYQHMINAGRRLYVNAVGEHFEERWLDEGLAHIAEDINFWRAAGQEYASRISTTASSPTRKRPPRIRRSSRTISCATGSTLRDRKFSRRSDSMHSMTICRRAGPIWSFLRFAADHQPVGQDNTFWFKLVNSTTSGIENLTAALGGSPYPLLRDWSISVFLDDNAANVDPRFQQPSCESAKRIDERRDVARFHCSRTCLPTTPTRRP